MCVCLYEMQSSPRQPEKQLRNKYLHFNLEVVGQDGSVVHF